jgi:hypothetical protein
MKGCVVITILWLASFLKNEGINDNREKLIAAIIGSVLGLFIARLAANFIPYRRRPIHNPELLFRIPHEPVKDFVSKPFVKLYNNYPGIFYAAFFFITFQIATMYDDIRYIIHLFLSEMHFLKPM